MNWFQIDFWFSWIPNPIKFFYVWGIFSNKCDECKQEGKGQSRNRKSCINKQCGQYGIQKSVAKNTFLEKINFKNYWMWIVGIWYFCQRQTAQSVMSLSDAFSHFNPQGKTIGKDNFARNCFRTFRLYCA